MKAIETHNRALDSVCDALFNDINSYASRRGTHDAVGTKKSLRSNERFSAVYFLYYDYKIANSHYLAIALL